MGKNQPFNSGEISFNWLTTIIFWGVVVALPTLAYFLSPNWIFPVYGFVPLTYGFWAFLREPRIKISSQRMKTLSSKYPDLEYQINNFPAYATLKRPPILLFIPTDTNEIFSFGTWRHKYIAISEGAIEHWGNPETLKSVITHEIAHIFNGDVWKLGLITQYLYGLLGMTLWTAIRSFPYSLFFHVYASFRSDNGIADIITSLTIFLLDFAIFLIVRFLYRIKEYDADAYSKKYINIRDYVKAFVVFPQKSDTQISKHSKSTTLQQQLFRLFGFHPSARARLIALNSPNYILGELPSLLFVVGIFIGYISCLYLDLDKSFAVMLSSEISVGYLIVSVLFFTHKLKDMSLTARIMFCVRNISNIANGVAIAFIIFVGVNNLLITVKSGVGNAMGFRQGIDLRDALFSTLDVAVLILILAPFLILSLVVLASILIKGCTVRGIIWNPILFSIVSAFPIISTIDYAITLWWKGIPLAYDKGPLLALLHMIWLLLITLIWRLISYLSYKKSREEVYEVQVS